MVAITVARVREIIEEIEQEILKREKQLTSQEAFALLVEKLAATEAGEGHVPIRTEVWEAEQLGATLHNPMSVGVGHPPADADDMVEGQ